MSDDAKRNFRARVTSATSDSKRDLDDWLKGPGATVFAVVAVCLVAWFVLTSLGVI